MTTSASQLNCGAMHTGVRRDQTSEPSQRMTRHD
jgi:hypothetical protein